MAQPPRVRAFTRESIPGAEAWAEPLFQLLNETAGQSADALTQKLTFTENFAAQLKDVTVTPPAPSWRSASFINSWVDYQPGTEQETQFRREGTDRVLLRGLARAGTLGSGAFTLPVGYRPNRNLHFPSVANGADAYTKVDTNGVVTPQNGSNVWFSFAGIAFEATTPALPDVGASDYPPVKHTLPDVGGVLVVSCRADGVLPTTSSGLPVLDWEKASANSIRIKAIGGLAPGRKYQLRLLLFVR